MSPTDEPKTDICASCGKPGVNGLETAVVDVPLCDDCTDHLMFDERFGSHFVTTALEPLPPPEQRFRALFEAARVLLEQGGAEEEQVIPTLAFANLLGQGYVNLLSIRRRLVEASGDPEEWARASDEFVERYGSLRPVRVADGVAILERRPVFTQIEFDPHEVAPKAVYIFVHTRRRLAEPEHVAQLYERELSDANISPDEEDMGSLSFKYVADRGLEITVHNGIVDEPVRGPRPWMTAKEASFPHPRFVKEFYRMLRGSSSGDGFARHLAARRRGPAPFADNLIPACVAFYLRDHGGIGNRGKVHRLINEHVLHVTHKSLPLDTSGGSATNQLWDNVDKVEPALRDSSLTLVSGAVE